MNAVQYIMTAGLTNIGTDNVVFLFQEIIVGPEHTGTDTIAFPSHNPVQLAHIGMETNVFLIGFIRSRQARAEESYIANHTRLTLQMTLVVVIPFLNLPF